MYAVSKLEEQKALANIKEIVESIGGLESYVGRAFDGAFEIAESNIHDDAWDSVSALQGKYKALLNELDTLDNTILTHWKPEVDKLDVLISEKEDAIVGLKERLAEAGQKGAGLASEMDEMTYKLSVAEQRNDQKDAEIIQLKAKLYDLMTID